MALNPRCTPGRVVPDPADEAAHAALCGCGWSEGGFPSRSAAKRAQREHRFPPRPEAVQFTPPIFYQTTTPRQVPLDLCSLGQHRPAYLARGGVACGRCGVPL